MINTIAIVGYGLEGESAFKFLRAKYPEAKFTIYDQSQTPKFEIPAGVKTVLGDFDLKSIKEDLIIRTPAIAPYKFDENANLSSVTQLFFENCPAPIIGVTGSKGKGTTCSFIYNILKSAGIKTRLVGNIGLPALNELEAIQDNEVVVYELSSFQLWNLNKSPKVAVVVHIEPDHLDVHKSFEEYIMAKANIAKYHSASDVVIYDSTNQFSKQIADTSIAQKIAYPDTKTAHFDNEFIKYNNQNICKISDMKLVGEHNVRNACAAIDAAYQFTQDLNAIRAGIIGFAGLDHRLKLVKNVNGVDYYDDSISTTVGSVKAALNSIKKPKVLILGGSSKKVDFSDLKPLTANNNVKSIIVMGAEAGRLSDLLNYNEKPYDFYNFSTEKTMKEIVDFASELAEYGDAVILSPACASFGMFKDYKDRGDQFIKAVEEL